jgi:hypothetical protein
MFFRMLKWLRRHKNSRNRATLPSVIHPQGYLSRLVACFSRMVITSLLILLVLLSCFWIVVFNSKVNQIFTIL